MNSMISTCNWWYTAYFQVFNQLFYLKLEEDVNKVLFALPTEAYVAEDCLPESAVRLQKLMKYAYSVTGPNIIENAKKIERL